ncbi:pilus assembly protein PilE [Noviherbaspirillum denitrificans]|uniref:Pilus assembly protein PilE n=1 Tax=Noviherbaspirillum denitrificans TaxID=1968433 RepID=A0A254TLH0_9BURK|nr:pilus assembly protein PilE [Noviherbaspirillum denitrificans]
MKNKRKQGGFSLIQVIVALAVVAILAGIALPSFKEAARKAKRAEGRSALYQLMLQEERFYSQRNKYIAFTSGSSGEEEKRFRWFSGNSPESSAYEIKAEACAGETISDCVRLVATPGTGRVDANFKDPECGEFTLASTGEKGANKAECWR